MGENLTIRKINETDYAVIADMNRRLIEDEGSRNPMDRQALEERLVDWLKRNWQCVIFLNDNEPVGYAVFRIEKDEFFPTSVRVSLRQFFIERGSRTQGIGTACFIKLCVEFLPEGAAIRVQALESNPGSHAFWTRLGFQPYMTTYNLGKLPTAEAIEVKTPPTTSPPDNAQQPPAAKSGETT